MNKLVPIFIITSLVVGGGSFYSGMKYQQSKLPIRGSGNFANLANLSPEERQQRLQQFGGGGRRMGSGGQLGGFINGDVLSKDETSLTVKLRDGGSKIIFFSTSTQFMKSAEGTAADIKVGDSIMAGGTPNQDGSVTAQTIQIRPPSPTDNNK